MGNSASRKPPQAPRPRFGLTRLLTAALLILSLLSTIIFVGLAAWYANVHPFLDDYDDYESVGTWVTIFLIFTALIAGFAALGSHLVGLRHLWVWTTPGANAAQAAAWVAFGLLLLPFTLVWKEINIGGENLGDKSIAMEAFVVIATVVHLVYTLILYVTVDDR